MPFPIHKLSIFCFSRWNWIIINKDNHKLFRWGFFLSPPETQTLDIIGSGVLNSHIHFFNRQLALLGSRKPLCYTYTLVLLNNFPLFFPWDHFKLSNQPPRHAPVQPQDTGEWLGWICSESGIWTETHKNYLYCNATWKVASLLTSQNVSTSLQTAKINKNVTTEFWTMSLFIRRRRGGITSLQKTVLH